MSFGPSQPESVALGVEVFDLAAVDVDALDSPADVVRRLRAWHGHAVDLSPLEAAVVADVDLPVGSDRGAVRAASGGRRRGSSSPSGLTRASVPLWISTTTTLPSSMAIGPSGKRSPSHTKRRSATCSPSVLEFVCDSHSRGALRQACRLAVAGVDDGEASPRGRPASRSQDRWGRAPGRREVAPSPKAARPREACRPRRRPRDPCGPAAAPGAGATRRVHWRSVLLPTRSGGTRIVNSSSCPET